MKDLEKYFKKNKKAIIIIFMVIVAIVIIYFIGRKAGKKEPPKDVPINDPVDGQTTFNPGAYTDALYAEMSGNSLISGRRLKPYQDLMKLTETKFRAVYNDWNDRYFPQVGKTLIQRLSEEKEWSVPLFGSMFGNENAGFAALRDQIIDRAKTLNLY